jgi:hypothetical protein
MLACATRAAVAQPAAPTRYLLPIDFVNSAEARWLAKPVLARRLLDDMSRAETWKFSGTGTVSTRTATQLGDMHSLRVDMQMFTTTPAPNRTRLSSVNLQRLFANEDWSGYNRLSIWMRADFAGIPTVPLQLVLHNDGAVKVPDRYGREGVHYVTLGRNGWQQVVWEIDQLARDRITRLEIGYWVNRMLMNAGDHVAFEIGAIELQRVEPDHHTGWDVATGTLAYSHIGYRPGSAKTALASGLTASMFELVRVNDVAFGGTVLRKPVSTVDGPRGRFQQLDFSEVTTPGSYVLRAGDYTSQPFPIDDHAWTSSIWKTLNFYYGNRCGFDVPGVHGVDHLDWFATRGDQRISMSGGWHDAGDLSQGVINTGEGTYALFALAERVRGNGGDPALVARLFEEARWGLDWVLKVRFDGGYRLGFGSHNLWTNNIPGDADDRTVEAKNNPNANYIAAAAAAIGARLLRDSDPTLATRSLRIARDDWAHAIVGVEGPSTWHTPAFAASRMELAAIGITASLELFRATGEAQYRDKAVELGKIVTASQQVTRVGSTLPLSGFFYTGPDRDTIFHQFHRAADQAPIVALAQLVETLPDHADWMQWYATIARHAEYQKESARITAPYGVLPAYVYRTADSVQVPDSGGRYLEEQGEYAEQVRAGTPMGGDWFLRALPVAFQRRGNYGVLLSQAKGLSTASRVRRDAAGMQLAEQQAQWVVGRNPFAQSTMYGEGYGWSQQYSVSSGDFVGSLPVGMQSRGVSDVPYWPAQNMYVWKEVWVHTSNRWIWLMEELMPQGALPMLDFTVDGSSAPDGELTVRVRGTDAHRFTIRTDNATLRRSPATIAVQAGAVGSWRLRRVNGNAPVTVVVIADGDVSRRREWYLR